MWGGEKQGGGGVNVKCRREERKREGVRSNIGKEEREQKHPVWSICTWDRRALLANAAAGWTPLTCTLPALMRPTCARRHAFLLCGR